MGADELSAIQRGNRPEVVVSHTTIITIHSSDRIGVTTMRFAGLLSPQEQNGETSARASNGNLVVVYLAAALRGWKLDSHGYRRWRTGTRGVDCWRR